MYTVSQRLQKSTVTVYAQPEVVTAAESTTHHSCIHNELTFRKSMPILRLHAQINMP